MQGKSTEKLENGLFSYLVVDLYDKHTSPPQNPQLTQRRHRRFHSSFVHSTQRRIPQVAEFVVLVP